MTDSNKFSLITGLVAAVVVTAILFCLVSVVPNTHERMNCIDNDACVTKAINSGLDPSNYTIEKPSGMMIKNPFAWFCFEANWFEQIFTLFTLIYVFGWIYAEGSNPKYPSWLNWLSEFVGGASKVALVTVVVLGLSGKDKDKR